VSYNVKTAEFEGPFQLLLHLVSQRKVDIGNISIASVADQYLAYIDKLRELDMDVASDFIEVAASLLVIKAASLLPEQDDVALDEDFEEMVPSQARELLAQRLIVYKQFKNAAAALGVRMESEARMHPRQAALEPQFLQVLPDYLEGLDLADLAAICARLASRREVFLLQARHIAARPIPVESRIGELCERLSAKQQQTFSELLGASTDTVQVVVTFLAILELYHRGFIDLEQSGFEQDISVHWVDPTCRAPAPIVQQSAPIDDYLDAANAAHAAQDSKHKDSKHKDSKHTKSGAAGNAAGATTNVNVTVSTAANNDARANGTNTHISASSPSLKPQGALHE
jgi:segregation and condensation protein A